jgi:hypothetical protein
MKNLLLALLLAGCGGDGPNETCTNTVCPTGKLYQLCTSGTSQVRYVLGGTSCACGATSCSECLTLVSAYCNDPNTNGTTGTNGGTNGGTSGSTTGTNGGTTGGTTGGACKAGGIACQSFDECCSGTCANQVCTQCRDNGTSCTLASECCSNICHDGSCRACGTSGTSCTDSHECCNGLSCIGGACGGPDPDCNSQDSNNCVICCQGKHTAGANDYSGIASSCVCQAATCMTACGQIVCPSPAPMGDPTSCENCFVSSCKPSTDAACMSNSSCASYEACINACPTM